MDSNAMDITIHKNSLVASELLALPRKDLVKHLRSLVSSGTSVYQVTVDLLDHIHLSRLPPYILTTWLPIAIRSDPAVLRVVISDTISCNARKIGLGILRCVDKKHFVPKSRIWETIGGPQGLIELFTILSHQDVRTLARVVGQNRAFRDNINPQEADALILQLLPGLLRNGDPMDLDTEGSLCAQTENLSSLLHLGSDDLVAQLFNELYSPDLKAFNDMPFALASSHVNILRQIATGRVAAHPKARKNLLLSRRSLWLMKLIESKQPYSPTADLAQEFGDPTIVHPGIPFVIDLLNCAQDILKWDTSQVVYKALECAIHAKTPFQYIVPLFQYFPTNIGWPSRTPVFRLAKNVIKFWSMTFTSPVLERDMVKQLPANHPSRPAEGDRAQLEDLLKRHLSESGQQVTQDSVIDLSDVDRFLPYMQRSARLGFIKLFFRYFHQLDLEEQPTASSVTKHDLTICPKTFEFLHGSDAQWLYENLEALAHSEDFIHFPGTYSAYSFAIRADENLHCRALFGAFLESQNAAFDGAISLYKERAEASSTPNVRQQWVCNAIEVAAKSENLALLKDVTIWSERFLNDPRIGADIHNFLCKPFYANVLSCVSFTDSRRYNSLEVLAKQIEEANSILNLHIDLMLKLCQLPSFNHYSYGNIHVSLFSYVARQRGSCIRHFQKLGLATLEKIRDILLGSLKPILLRYESIGLSDEFESLHWDHTHGVLRRLSYCFGHPNAMLPFLDDLAKERDLIWAQARAARNPAVSSLGAMWPKGLAVQHLLPEEKLWFSQVLKKPELAPYIYQRARAVMYFSEEAAKPVQPADEEVISCFTDDLITVIQAYIKSLDKSQVGPAVVRLWKHYENVLGYQFHRYSTLRALLSDSLGHLKHWQQKKAKIELGLEVPYKALINPLPQIATGKPWQPAPEHQAPSAMGELTSELTVLDCLLHCRRHSFFFDGRFPKIKDQPSDQSDDAPNVWIPPMFLRKLPLETQDAVIVTAILVLDKIYGSELGANQFKEFEYRSQHVKLDDMFLSLPGTRSTESLARHALKTLQHTVNVVPAEQLHWLADKLLHAAAAKSEGVGYTASVKAAFKVLSLLTESDKPQLAIDLALQALQLLPTESKWHQHVISPRFASRLPRNYARALAIGLIDHVTNSIEAKKDMAVDDPERPIIKVSTVKMMTTHLGTLLGPEEAETSLKSLFQLTCHVDVRKAILESLIDLIAGYYATNIQQSSRIYNTLVALSSVAAQPSERSPTSARAWKEAEDGGEMPTVDEERPIQDLLLFEAKGRLPKDLHENYVNAVIIPILKLSAENCNRWFHIFLDRLPLSDKARTVTDFGPFSSAIVERIFVTWRQHLPKSFLIDQRMNALSYIAFSKLSEVNALLDSADKGWRDTRAGRVWQKRWEECSARHTFSALAKMIFSEETTLVTNGITHEDLVNEFNEQALLVAHFPIVARSKGLLIDRAPFNAMWDSLQPRASPTIMKQLKKEKATILGNIAAELQRRHALNEAPEGGLPCSYILPAPYTLVPATFPYLDKDDSELIASMMSSVIEAIGQCAVDMNMGAFQEIVTAVQQRLSGDEKARCAAVLGNVPVQESVSLENSLRISMACQLLEHSSHPENDDVKFMLKNWGSSSVQWVRLQGLRIKNEAVQTFVSDLLLNSK